MPEVGWVDRDIGDCLDASFAGEWGSEPDSNSTVVLRATDIDDDGHVIAGGAARSIPAAKLSAKQLKNGDILLEASGGGPGKPVGRVALFDAKSHVGPAICSNFFRTLRPARRVVNDRFLWRKLDWFYRQPALLALQQQTTGIINLKFAEYLSAQIEVPLDLLEQARIAKILDTLDTTIRQTEAIIEKLKQVKQGLLHDLLTRGIDANGELRPPQSEAPHLYKESALGWIPQAWRVERLPSLASRGLMNGVFKEPKRVGRGVALVNVADLYRGENVDLARCERFDATRIEQERFSVARGDIFFTRSSLKLEGIAQTSFVDDEPDGAVFECHVMRLRPNPTVSVPRFLKEWCVAASARSHFMSHAKQVTMTTISQDGISSLLCPVPALVEQTDAVRRIMALDERVRSERNVLHKSKELKSGLMDDLLTGRVRVTPLLDLATDT